jgi:zinc/manganese transport system substrate-binding protein
MRIVLISKRSAMHTEWRPVNFSLWLALLGLLLATSACGSGESDSGAELPNVVATTTIWADVVSKMTCGELVNVASVIPAGSDPHSFEPSLADRAQMDNAALLVANGLGLEAGLEDTLAASAETGTTLIEIGHLMDPVDGDPHVWLDPTRVADALSVLSDQIVTATEVERDRVDACAVAYRSELLKLDEEIKAMLAPIPATGRKLVTNHDSLGYFAARYGFEIVGSVIPSTSGLGEASPANLDALATLIRAEEVPAIFTEAQASADVAEALAEQLPGVRVIELETGSLRYDNSQAGTYVELLRRNAELIAEGLS